jgi:hypothetical protein
VESGENEHSGNPGEPRANQTECPVRILLSLVGVLICPSDFGTLLFGVKILLFLFGLLVGLIAGSTLLKCALDCISCCWAGSGDGNGVKVLLDQSIRDNYSLPIRVFGVYPMPRAIGMGGVSESV